MGIMVCLNVITVFSKLQIVCHSKSYFLFSLFSTICLFSSIFYRSPSSLLSFLSPLSTLLLSSINFCLFSFFSPSLHSLLSLQLSFCPFVLSLHSIMSPFFSLLFLHLFFLFLSILCYLLSFSLPMFCLSFIFS